MKSLSKRMDQLETELDEKEGPGIPDPLTPEELARKKELDIILEYRDHTIDEVVELRRFMCKRIHAREAAGIVSKCPPNLAELMRAAQERAEERHERIRARGLTPEEVEKTLKGLMPNYGKEANNG